MSPAKRAAAKRTDEEPVEDAPAHEVESPSAPGIPAPPGFTRMTNAELRATADVPDPAVPFHLSRGWEAVETDTTTPSGDPTTTPEA